MKKTIKTIIFILIITMITSYSHVFAIQNINEDTINKNVDNILLIGRDSINSNGPSRSDTMIILTIDNLNKQLKLTSLVRDTLVKIPGKGYEKLNHAYAYGKEELLMQTINENFDININDYAVVDFKSFTELIDILGGVEVDIDENELDHLNKFIKVCHDLNDKNKGNIEYIEKSGTNNLNGYQALAYARIRKIDTIYKRDARQREILTNLAYKMANTSITNYVPIIKTALNYVDVNISLDKIMRLAFSAHEMASYEIKQMEFPFEDYREEGRLNNNGTYVVKWNIDKNIELLHNFIYGGQ